MSPDDAVKFARIAVHGGATLFTEDRAPLSPDRAIPRAAAIILAGAELGLGPMSALRLIRVIDGRISIGSEAMAALARKAGHHVEIEDLPDACRVSVRRSGETEAYILEFTMAMAKRANLVRDRGPWANHPAAMLRARAVAAAIRAACPDVSLGIYEPGEIEEITASSDPTPSPWLADIAAAPDLAALEALAVRLQSAPDEIRRDPGIRAAYAGRRAALAQAAAADPIPTS